MSDGQRKKSSGSQPATQIWRRGASRLMEQGKLMWLLGEGMNAVLEAQSQGVTPLCDEAGLVGTVFKVLGLGLAFPVATRLSAVCRRR